MGLAWAGALASSRLVRIWLHNAAMPRSSQILDHAAGDLPAPGEWQSARPVPLLANLQRLTAPNPGFMTGPGTNSYLVGDATTGYFVIDPGPADAAHIARRARTVSADRG